MKRYPKVEYIEEVMREGMQIEDPNIPVEDKLRLLHALGETGLKRINVGSFVSPRWVPQMACIDELMKRFKPKPGVTYIATALNPQGVERLKQYVPPLTIRFGAMDLTNLRCHMSDVFARRNTNRAQAEELARWPGIVAQAKEAGVKEVGFGVATAWGCNWVGEFTLEKLMGVLERQHKLWDEVEIKVTHIRLSDEMSWNTPHRVEETLVAIKGRWPNVTRFNLHLHNARGMALASTYAALRVLDHTDTLIIDGTLGGIGGCPYCGNGQATGLMPTEDILHMLEGMGIETGVDLDKIIDCVWLLEEIIGRPTFGHVSKAGPRPESLDKWYPMDMPFIQTLEQAKHFKLGPKAYEGCVFPWREMIQSPQRLEMEKAWKDLRRGTS